MRGNGGRDENNLLEIESFSNLFCPPEVTQMDGIEGSSKKTDPPSYERLFNFRSSLHKKKMKHQ
jgi:hypothetical protein